MYSYLLGQTYIDDLLTLNKCLSKKVYLVFLSSSLRWVNLGICKYKGNFFNDAYVINFRGELVRAKMNALKC